MQDRVRRYVGSWKTNEVVLCYTDYFDMGVNPLPDYEGNFGLTISSLTERQISICVRVLDIRNKQKCHIC